MDVIILSLFIAGLQETIVHTGNSRFRNREWFHMINEYAISMPDKRMCPRYAVWDLERLHS